MLSATPVASTLYDLDLGDELDLSDTEPTLDSTRHALRSSMLTLGGSTSQTLKRNAELASPLLEPESDWAATQRAHAQQQQQQQEEEEEEEEPVHRTVKFDAFVSLIDEFQLDMDPTATIKSGISESTLAAMSPPTSPVATEHMSKHALRRATSTPCQRITPEMESELHASYHSHKVNPIGKVISALHANSTVSRSGGLEKLAIFSSAAALTGGNDFMPATASPTGSEQSFDSLEASVNAEMTKPSTDRLETSKKQAGLKNMFKRGSWRKK
ncbi:hypothetical protein BJ741DRAFT_592679 [Chytriomyces cf. hyalinus JEL632]|nr:hypothetical protein BJ741DRAFT_592679 [Chytriomyces cf. hyalinus JEL632]